MPLSSQQQRVLDAIQAGENLFFTGSAGTGKSHVLQCIQKRYAKEDGCVLTGTTGIAAHNIGGVTIHNFAGLGVDTTNVDAVIQRCLKNRVVRERYVTHVFLVESLKI